MKPTMQCALLMFALFSPISAQTTPQFKGIWEPVNYNEDLQLLDVFFANVDVGWVAGAAGTILHTSDGGKSWTAQLGGDPENRAEAISRLRFVDERHGWAVHGRKLLRTSDGEDWEEIGTLPYGLADLVFISSQDGFLAGKSVETSSSAQVIYRTSDGGRTWKPVWSCAAKVTMRGLVQTIGCHVQSFHFPSANVGYAVLGTNCVGMGCGPPPLIAKTEDGGETWRALVGPGVMEEDFVSSLFFLDEQTGFVRLASGKLHSTKDGGQTWRGLVASPGAWIRFADPSVGWAYDGATLTYSTDGGGRWNARPLRFPATPTALSFPRRDRAYAVGPHGMVYRYRVVPAAHAVRANDISAPAMPGFESPLDKQIDQLETIITDLSSAIGAPATPASGTAAVAAEASGEALNTPLPAPSEFTAKCCGKSFSRLEVVLGALSQSLPQFIDKYKNLNLLLAAVRMGAEMPDQYRSVKVGLGAFRKADNKEAAQAALSSVSAALSAFKQTTAVALQKQLPPPGSQ